MSIVVFFPVLGMHRSMGETSLIAVTRNASTAAGVDARICCDND